MIENNFAELWFVSVIIVISVGMGISIWHSTKYNSLAVLYGGIVVIGYMIITAIVILIPASDQLEIDRDLEIENTDCNNLKQLYKDYDGISLSTQKEIQAKYTFECLKVEEEWWK